ncbi:MAG: hypothetical protein NZM31_14620 [Gemmatales bacterium]|nr:hypothetical protein [Gemmatales bacterium]MDW8388230.1 hypothetical protein [Gemmatales bacterium]
MCSRRVVLSALILLLAAGPARAQAPEIIWCRQPVFRIPFQIEPGDENRLKEVQLYLKLGEQGSWRLVKTVGPRERHFPFRAENDGLHQFLVRTVDLEGRAYPPRVEDAPPGLRVMVDTALPQAVLRQLPPRGEQIGIEWEVRDEHLDLNSLQIDVRSQGALAWQALPVDPVAFGQKYFSPPSRGPIEVRLRVKDRAENQGSAYLLIQGGGQDVVRRDAESWPTATPSPSGSATPRERDIRYINTTDLSLAYTLEDVGPSGVSVVELWFTRDGRTWQRHGEDPDKTSPFQVRFNSEGLYGLTLVVKSGVGLGDRPPQPGDPPQLWVEVDLTKPVVELRSVEAGRGPDAGTVTITWRAEDKNLAPAPISLYYAENPEGPWTIMTGGLENSGRYVWRVPPGVPYRFHVRVEAVDKGGNVGRADSSKPVIVDLSVPKGRILGVDGSNR